MTTKPKDKKRGLVIDVDTPVEEAHKIGEEVKKRGMEVPSVYCGAIPVNKSLEAGIEGMRKIIDNCAAAGARSILMGGTMWLQQLLNPQPADPIQARVMNLLPIFFTFLFATFPAGLVIYWTWNNLLSIGQQWLIMKRMGVKPG